MPSLYVHVPFCLRKCEYCAFYSVSADQQKISDYLQGLEREIQLRQMEAPFGVSSLFLGGGTPTALDARDMEKLLRLIHQKFNFTEHPQDRYGKIEPEKTMEANPGTLDHDKLRVMFDHGINRISLGVQSFNDQLLQSIGRIHTSKDILKGVDLIRKIGFTNINVDLMFGLPGQNMEEWQDTLKKAVELSPEHLSLYALSLEEGTPLAIRYSQMNTHLDLLPDGDDQADMYEWAVQFLLDKGYHHYEVSNFARPGYECRHNLSYWNSDDYIGLGPGAVSCSKNVRTKNVENVASYAQLLSAGGLPVDEMESEVLTKEQRISEYVMLRLRTTQGIELKTFEQIFNVSFQDIFGHKLINYIDREWIIQGSGRLIINPRYFFVTNSILQDFILNASENYS